MYKELRNTSEGSTYNLLFTTEDGFSDQMYNRFLHSEVKKKEDDLVLFHCDNDKSDILALQIDPYNGKSSFYPDDLINAKFRGIINSMRNNEYYILQINTTENKYVYIVRTYMNTELKVNVHTTSIIYNGKPIGHFNAKADKMNKLYSKINNIINEKNIHTSWLNLWEESSFRNLYSKKSLSDVKITNINGIRISSNKELDLLTKSSNNN